MQQIGLVDSDGNIKSSILNDKSNSLSGAFDKTKYARINSMSKKTNLDLSHIRTDEDLELTFKPARSEDGTSLSRTS